MPPGLKKKTATRKDAEDKSGNIGKKKQSASRSADLNRDVKSESPKKDLAEENTGEHEKYSRRSIESNWNRYCEQPNDDQLGITRGADYEVLLSYSGGLGSELHLREEQEWDKCGDEVKNIILDFNDLSNSFRCLPFHVRFDLPQDIFDSSQIDKFCKYAENCRNTYVSQKKAAESVAVKNEEIVPPNGENLSIKIENDDEPEIYDESIVKPLVIAEKTENLIESLASCLSLKGKQDVNIVQETKAAEKPEKSADASNDLDFLLSLSVPTNSLSSTSSKVAKKSDSVNASVDDWLKSILDD